VLVARFYPDVDASTASSLELFADLAHRTRVRACPCRHSLLLADGTRCPCVAARTNCLPLRLGAFAPARSGSSALSSGGFTELHACLRERFHLAALHEILALDTPALAPIDVLVICTTEGPALGADELAALRAWVQRGGALITSAFSNWSAHAHFAAETVAWLGLRTVPQARFLPRLTHAIEPTVCATRDRTRGHRTLRRCSRPMLAARAHVPCSRPVLTSRAHVPADTSRRRDASVSP